jgi:hypothetical protein
MVIVTVITGIAGVVHWLSYVLAHLERQPSLADVREYQETTSLFWPALLVTGVIWLVRSQVQTTRISLRIASLALTAVALYGVVSSTFMGEEPERDALFLRTWDCPAGLRAWDLQAQDPRCKERPIDDMRWFIIEEDDFFNVSSPTLQEPSSREGNTATWDDLPRGLYVLNVATDTDLSSYDSVVLITIQDEAAWGFPLSMRSGKPVDQPNWSARVEISPQIQGYDLYFIPGTTVFAAGDEPGPG